MIDCLIDDVTAAARRLASPRFVDRKVLFEEGDGRAGSEAE